MIVTINTHYCTAEELQELLDYLESQMWDYRTQRLGMGDKWPVTSA